MLGCMHGNTLSKNDPLCTAMAVRFKNRLDARVDRT